MEATIVNYRSGVHTQRRNQVIIRVDGVKDRRQAGKLIGRKIFWTSPKGRQIAGKIISTHGDNGFLLAAFKRSLPHAVGVKVVVAD